MREKNTMKFYTTVKQREMNEKHDTKKIERGFVEKRKEEASIGGGMNQCVSERTL